MKNLENSLQGNNTSKLNEYKNWLERIFDTIKQKELEQLKNSSPKNRKINDRNNLMLDFLFYTGLRINELINICHCDYQNNQLRILGKGNKVRFVFVPGFLVKYFNG